jgi:hypothetical protein
MKRLPVLLSLWLAILCGCQTSNPVGNPLAEGGKLSLRIDIPDYELRYEPGSVRIYVDGSFAGSYAEDLVLQLPPGKHKIAVQIARAVAVRRQDDRTPMVTHLKVTGKETIMVFGGESLQTVVFDMSNLKTLEERD